MGGEVALFGWKHGDLNRNDSKFIEKLETSHREN